MAIRASDGANKEPPITTQRIIDNNKEPPITTQRIIDNNKETPTTTQRIIDSNKGQCRPPLRAEVSWWWQQNAESGFC